MKIILSKPSAILARIGLGGIALLVALAMAFLFIGCMLGTADMSTENAMQELITFQKDSLLKNIGYLLLFSALGVALILVLRRLGWLNRITRWHLSLAIFLWILITGSAWVLMSMSAPTHDSLIVTRAGIAAALGEMKYLQEDYFIRFPFQSGYVLWTELWARLFGLDHSSYLFMEFVNVICLALGEAALVLTTDKLFGRRDVTFATTLALAAFFQPVIFSTFLYGNIPGFCFAAWAVYLFVCYLKHDRWWVLAISAACLIISVSLKLNNMILLVAMGIILVAHLLRGKPLRRLIALVLLCVSVLTLTNVAKLQYEKRLDKELGDGIPMISWMAMGLHDAPTAPGWYNGKYTVTNFHSAGNDPDVAGEKSKEVIKERLSYFADNPKEAADFFRDKILSQWSETTYQSLWNNQVRGQFMPKYGLAKYVCGEGEDTVKGWMDLGAQFLYGGMLIAAVYLVISQIKKNPARPEDESALFLIPLIFLGGFLYHALFEAKSQYVITYVTFMIPYAIWGFAMISGTVKRLVIRMIDRIRTAKEKTTES